MPHLREQRPDCDNELWLIQRENIQNLVPVSVPLGAQRHLSRFALARAVGPKDARTLFARNADITKAGRSSLRTISKKHLCASLWTSWVATTPQMK